MLIDGFIESDPSDASMLTAGAEPIGMNLFIASYRFKKPITELYHASVPFILVLLLSVLIITYWPGLSLALL